MLQGWRHGLERSAIAQGTGLALDDATLRILAGGVVSHELQHRGIGRRQHRVHQELEAFLIVRIGDVALMPFIRQFAHVDREWFAQTPYRRLQALLQRFLESSLFTSVMFK